MISRSPGIAAAVAALIFAGAAGAQYFGQNKVRYRTLNFEVLKTEHFDIYYDAEAKEMAVKIGRMAERWYARLASVLEWELSSRQPLIIYASHPDFRGTTAIQGYIGETTGGVTEGLRRRVVMPLTGTLAETDHVLGHELVHAFQFDISTRPGPMGGSGLPGVLRLPLWFVEGMAEYLSLGPVDPHTAMWLRDAVRREAVPLIRRLDDPQYFPYRYGHAFWAFVAGRHGDQVVGRILKAAGRAGSAEGAITSVLGVSIDALSEQWKDALLAEYEPVLKATEPVSAQGSELVSKQRRGGALNVSPVLSPDGRWMIFYSERDLFSIDIFLADARTGQIRRKITETAVDAHADSLQFVNSAGTWSPDSRRVAFAGVRAGRPELSFFDVEQGRVTRRIRFPSLGEIYTPDWSPDGREIVFSAIANGITDLFVVDIETEKLRRLTEDAFADLQPSWSPDGRNIAFVTDRFTTDLDLLAAGGYRLALVDAVAGKIEAVAGFRSGKHTNPQWGDEGRSLYFLSDRDGIANIYRLDRGSGRLHQVTNLQTGVSGISSLSPAFSVARGGGRLVFSAFLGGDYGIFGLDSPEALAGRPATDTLAALAPGALPPARREAGPVAALLAQPVQGLAATDGFRFDRYRPQLALDYIAPPQISVGMSSFGSMIGGGTALYFSDLLGKHNLMTAFQTSTTSEAGNFLNNLSAIAAYQNQKRRWTWGVIGGQVPFLTGGYGTGFGRIGGQPVVVEQAVTLWQIDRELAGLLAYPFNRAQRVEFTGGYRNIAFAGQETTAIFSALTGQFLGEERRKIPTADSIHLGTASTALVYDTSIFGGTSPIFGQRYRLELGAVGGGLTHSTLLGDYRRYFRLARPLTLAGRVLHYGRYGGDAEDPRLQNMFIGFPSLVRGYSPGSFQAHECGPASETSSGCPVFDQLLGSRMAVANAELRVPILGFLGVVPSRGFPPVEAAAFYDAGIAWSRAEKANFLGGPRQPVSSAGATLRANVLGFFVLQASYVHPLDRPARKWLWEFSILPGF